MRVAFVDGAATLDPAALERALDEMFAAGSFERVVEERLYPALSAIGDAWAAGEVDVAGEHAASAAAMRRLSMAFEAAGSTVANGLPILVGLPPGARHELGALAFATAARRAGFSVVYLGPDVPLESWARAVETTNARAAVIGAVVERDVDAASEVVLVLGAAHPDVIVAVGGRAAESVGNGGVVRLPDGLRDAVEALRAALA
jgi:methanogenic corrinoid protein MtbC1